MENRLVNPNDCKCIQSRVLLDPATVQDYADMMDKGVAFDPCKAVITHMGAILVYDGNHRVEAAKVNGSMIEVEIMVGTERDAEWLAFGANTRHGLRRSPDDIAKAVKAALRHPNALGKSDRELARHCGCDHKTVGKYRKELEASGERPQIATRTVQRNGQEYQMTIPMPDPAPEPEPARDASPQVFDRHMPTPDRENQSFDVRLERCKACMDRVFAVKEGIILITEVNEHLAKVRGVLYPRPGEHPGWAAKTVNLELEDLRHEMTKDDWAQAKDAMWSKGENPLLPDYEKITITTPEEKIDIIAPAYHPNDEQKQLREVHEKYGLVPEQDQPSLEERIVCDACGGAMLKHRIYTAHNTWQGTDVNICLTCAQKALHELLDPDDPGAVHVAQQTEQETLRPEDAFRFYHADREKICYAGLRLISPRGEFGKHQLQEMLPNKNGNPGHTWQKLEEFPSKAALLRRVKELEDDANVIIERHL